MATIEIPITTGIGGDAFISSSGATNNYGAHQWNQMDSNMISKFLIRFDLSGMSGEAEISAAKIKFYQANSVAYTVGVSAYKVSDANGDWIEGIGTGGTALEDENCWNAKKADGSGGVKTAWAGAAGLATAGTDYVNTVIASASVDWSGAIGTLNEVPFNADGLAVLESWCGEATNNGMLFVCDHTSSYRWNTKNVATAGLRPVLEITYTS